MGRMMMLMRKLIISNRILAVSVLLLMIVIGSMPASTLPLWGQIAPTYPVIHMNDTSVSFGSLVYAGRQINAEYVTTSSQLVGDKIDSITLGLQRVGSPTGTAEIGIFNTDLSVKKLFGTIDVSTISTTFRDYEFTLGSSELYTIVSGDRIGIKYNGGSSSRGVNVMIDRNEADPFDAKNSHRIRYESGSGWLYFDTVEDLYMTLKQTHGESSTSQQTVGLTVTTQNGAGNSITGYYITVRQNGALIGSGFSPRTFSIQTGQQYVVGVADYGTMVFHHWLDNGSTDRYRTISVSSAITITAVMCSSGSYCPPAGSPPSTPSISLNPSSGLPGVSVTVTGSAFSASSAVTITYDGMTRATTPSSLTTSSSGTFTASFTVPSTSSGPHTVQATDNTGKSVSATFTDNTSSGSSSSAPVANSQSVTTNENTPRAITLSGSDPNGDPIEFYIISEPSHGALTLIDQTSRQVRYTPWSYYNGPDSFTFVTSDGVRDSSPATVSITVSNTAQKSTSRLVVESVHTNDRTVSGLQVSLSQNNAVIQTASTPFQFFLNSGQQYSITASNGNGLVFDHWLDTGSTNRNRTVSITDDTLLVAVYRNS